MTSGGAAGMSGQVLVTSGGHGVTNGGERRARRLALLAIAAVGLGFAVVNALSELDERSRMGRPVAPAEPWVWELSSWVVVLVLAPVVFLASQRLRPPLLPWTASVPLLAILSIPFSLLHSAMMIGLRHAVYALAGETYRNAGPLLDVLLYEYRKDLLTYAILLVLPHLAQRIFARSDGLSARESDYRIEVRDGSRIVWLSPDDVDWAQSAGNYVELHGAFGTLLHRRTLAALEDELAPHGFVRIHRSRLVRRSAVTRVETNPSGDFEATLADGTSVGGSRRFRASLA